MTGEMPVSKHKSSLNHLNTAVGISVSLSMSLTEKVTHMIHVVAFPFLTH